MAYTKKGNHIREAAEALSDLNVFAIVVSTLEGGHLHAKSFPAAEQIIRLCKVAQGRRLREFDKAVAKAGGGTYGR